ncbi:MAG: ATP-binding cassette domain-containing protein [Oscillospiraceae bacterium]
MNTFCKIENLTKRYEQDEDCPVNNLSFTINEGDFISIEGPSGTGKSTLLYMIGGLIKPTEGKIFFEETELTTMSDKEITKWRKEKMGFIFQETILFAALTAKENLIQELKMKQHLPKSEANKQTEIYLEKVGLSERADYLPHQLSVGQRRRLIIARALMSDARLILADEPTNDLDDTWSEKIINMLIEKSKSGCAVIMVTHNNKWAKRAFSRYVLENGTINLMEKSESIN